MGLEGREELLEAVDAFNVLDRYPGSEGPKGDAFPISWARRRARRLYPRLRGRTVLLAGKRVATAFGIKSDYLRWEDHPEGFRVAVIPHPSGVNHWWNEPANRRRFRRFVEEEMRGCT